MFPAGVDPLKEGFAVDDPVLPAAVPVAAFNPNMLPLAGCVILLEVSKVPPQVALAVAP